MANMFKREIENELKKWKQFLSSSRQAVVVKGLRQIGKTTSVLGFCRENFPSVVHIDFRRRLQADQGQPRASRGGRDLALVYVDVLAGVSIGRLISTERAIRRRSPAWHLERLIIEKSL